jgi:hypothetical protein
VKNPTAGSSPCSVRLVNSPLKCRRYLAVCVRGSARTQARQHAEAGSSCEPTAARSARRATTHNTRACPPAGASVRGPALLAEHRAPVLPLLLLDRVDVLQQYNMMQMHGRSRACKVALLPVARHKTPLRAHDTTTHAVALLPVARHENACTQPRTRTTQPRMRTAPPRTRRPRASAPARA